MKAVVQRVKDASVSVEGRTCGRAASGLLVYLGVAWDDTEDDALRLAEKVVHLRIFADSRGVMNLSVKEAAATTSEESGEGAAILAVSQFTLLADTRRGRRPYYGNAAEPEEARRLYEYFVEKIRQQGIVCETGVFGARMEVRYTNDGPVTILLDTRE
ncbi:MAG: D-tyrosyl-tRNA(Tyr) deacylase [Treponema sp.]|jgi:D-tyrosyl-tRNA(Tyr) deacylase|nr:D-tyrosyl-tRNA(Tyr) deacylase [Treponema sp.]